MSEKATKRQQMSEAGTELLKSYEELRLKPYDDATGKEVKSLAECAGKPTIGWGHVILKDEPSLWKGITKAQAEALFLRDLEPRERTVERLVDVPLSQGQFDALVSWEFNTGALRGSTLLRRLNEGNYASVPQQIRRWVYDNGVRVPGLAARREREILLWKGQA